MFALKCLGVFVALMAVDMCWTFYIAKVGEGKAVPAACWSAMIMVCGGLAMFEYLEDKRLFLPALAGAFVGTYLTVKFENRKKVP